MPSAKTSAAILFYAGVISAIAAAIFIGQWLYGHWKRVGNMNQIHISGRRLLVIMVLLVAALSMGGAGLWINARRPAIPPVSSIPQQEAKSDNPSRPTAAPVISAPTKPRSSVSTKPKTSGPDSSPPPVPAAIAPAAPIQPAYSIGQCVGSACAQGPNAQATYVQNGEIPRHISEQVKKSLGECLSKNKGTVSINWRDGFDSYGLMKDFSDAFRLGGWDHNERGDYSMLTSSPPLGVVISSQLKPSPSGLLNRDDDPVAFDAIACINKEKLPKGYLFTTSDSPKGHISISVGAESK